MKKVFALIIAAVLAAGCISTAAFAEEAKEEGTVMEISWSEIAEAMGDEFEGDFVTFDDVAFKMWLPDVFEEKELTDEELELGYIGCYAAADDEAIITVLFLDGLDMDLLEYEELLGEDESVTELEEAIVNDIPCITYKVEDTDSMSITFETEDSGLVEVTFIPASDEGFSQIASIISGSIMAEDDEEE